MVLNCIGHGECQGSFRISLVLECVDSVLSSAGYAARRWSSLHGGLSQTSPATCHVGGGRFQRNGWRSRAAVSSRRRINQCFP